MSSWVVYRLTRPNGTSFNICAWDHDKMAEKLRWIHWSHEGFGLVAEHLPGLGYSDCSYDGAYLVLDGKRALENQAQIPMTQRRHDEYMSITAYYEDCRKRGINSGD